MAVPDDHHPVSADAFLNWIATQSDRHELVDGGVVRMMAGRDRTIPS